MNTPLQQAAQAMIDRWESPDWKDTPHTAHYVAELRKTLDAELAQSAEPYDTCLSNCETCKYSAINPVTDDSAYCYMFRNEPVGVCAKWSLIEAAPPQPQATTPEVPEGYVLVPIEATPAMDNAYRKSPCRDLSGLWHEIITAASQGEKP